MVVWILCSFALPLSTHSSTHFNHMVKFVYIYMSICYRFAIVACACLCEENTNKQTNKRTNEWKIQKQKQNKQLQHTTRGSFISIHSWHFLSYNVGMSIKRRMTSMWQKFHEISLLWWIRLSLEFQFQSLLFALFIRCGFFFSLRSFDKWWRWQRPNAPSNERGQHFSHKYTHSTFCQRTNVYIDIYICI